LAIEKLNINSKA